MAKAKKLATSASIAKKVVSATENLSVAKSDAETSVKALEKNRKKLLVENKGFAKKRTVLAKKKKTAAARLKKSPDATNSKALNAIIKELAVVKKAGDKARTASAANTAELKAIKASLKQVSAYMAAMAKVDKQLNKPKKKRAKKRATKPAVKLAIAA